jgi:hypothetical protein
MVFECIEKRYAVEIDSSLFSVLDGDTYSLDADGYKRNKKSLFDDLDKMSGVYDIEYNGHFGNFVYFSVATEDDKPSLHKKVERCIEKHLKRCAKYKAKYKL